MENENKSPYEQLLEEIANIKKENEKLRNDIKEVCDFNRALLSRNKDTTSTSNVDIKDKFKKYLEGE